MKVIKFWAIKIFFITLIISAGASVAVEYSIGSLSMGAAVVILACIVMVGIIFDIIGVAFSSCDHSPFMAMSAKKNKQAHYALRLLKNADIVANICNDVIGDICGIISGAAGASIALKAIAGGVSLPEMAVSIGISALIAAGTVGGKAAGKRFAFRNSKEIVLAIGAIIHFFEWKNKKNKGRQNEKKD